MALLETTDLSVTFGGLRALDQVNLSVGEGQLVGLIGPNGAGKTTFIDALTGFVPASGGVSFDGRPLQHLSPHQRTAAGLVRTWQSLELFDDLTVEENLRVAHERAGVAGFLTDIVRPRRRRDLTVVHDALDMVDIAELRARFPTELSQGQRKLVGVARALASRPKLVLLDEPAAGLDTAESQALGRSIQHLVAAGITVLLIDHDMGLVLTVCDHLYVIEFGRLIAQGTPAEIRQNDAVITAYLGTQGAGDLEQAKEALAGVPIGQADAAGAEGAG